MSIFILNDYTFNKHHSQKKENVDLVYIMFPYIEAKNMMAWYGNILHINGPLWGNQLPGS